MTQIQTQVDRFHLPVAGGFSVWFWLDTLRGQGLSRIQSMDFHSLEAMRVTCVYNIYNIW